MSSLGSNGRFANQLVQYMFLKTYARKHNLAVQTPWWIGQDLFGLQDPPIDRQLPEFRELYDKDSNRSVVPNLARPLVNVDFWGYFQYQSSYYAPHRDYILELFSPVHKYAEPLTRAVDSIRANHKTVIALHIRRSDYGYSYFYRTPTSWYLSLLESIWEQHERPLLFIASDALDEVLPDFRSYAPVTSRDFDLSMPNASYYPDFFFLSRANVLAICNSTFSFMAAMLNPDLKRAYRSRLSSPLDVPPFHPFDPWDSDFLDCSATVEQFKDIPGIGRPEIRQQERRGWKGILPRIRQRRKARSHE